MASYTSTLNLKKPSGSENVAIGDINGNMDLIDEFANGINTKLANIDVVAIGSVSSSGSKTITFTGTLVNVLLVGFGTSNGRQFMIMGRGSSSTTPNFTDISLGSAFSYTVDTGSVTISSSQGLATSIYALCIGGGGNRLSVT